MVLMELKRVQSLLSAQQGAFAPGVFDPFTALVISIVVIMIISIVVVMIITIATTSKFWQ